MPHPPGRATSLFAVALLAACNSAPVLPPADERTFELPRTSLWSGGELEVVVRYAEGEQSPPAVTLDGAALVVTRVDDTTFSAALPVHTGELPVEIGGEGVPTLAATVELHGYLGGGVGPPIEGHVVGVPGSAARVLGVSPLGLHEVSLATGQSLRLWGSETGSLACGFGVQHGLGPLEVVVRGQAADGSCLAPVLIHVGEQLTVTATIDMLDLGMAAPVGMGVLLRTMHDMPAWTFTCAPGWSPCAVAEGGFTQANHAMVGTRVHYGVDRVVTLASQAHLYRAMDGAALTELVAAGSPGWRNTLDAAFTGDGAVLYTVTESSPQPAHGSVLERNSITGVVTDSVGFPGQAAIAVAVDEATGRLLVATKGTAGVGLHVLERDPLRPVAFLPLADEAVATSIVPPGIVLGRMHHHLVVDGGNHAAYLIGTNYPRFNPNRRPAVIARWSLAD